MAGDDRSDLEAFVRGGSQDAFARLAGRHARMVYAACLSQLGSREDAEDAAQAVFLVLARKAGSVRPEQAGSWLYGAAMRVSRFMARGRRCRARREEEAGQMRASAEPRGEVGAAGISAEVQGQLLAEVGRLPAGLREAVVRHYLEGQTRAQLAAELGVPPGTVHSRLNAGIERLRERLARRGIALSVAALGPALAGAVPAGIPASLMASLPALASGSTAALAAAGIGAHVVVLAEGVLKMIFWEKVKVVAIAAGAAAVLAGVTPLALGAFSGENQPAPAAAPAQPAPADQPKAEVSQEQPIKLTVAANKVDGAPREAFKITLTFENTGKETVRIFLPRRDYWHYAKMLDVQGDPVRKDETAIAKQALMVPNSDMLEDYPELAPGAKVTRETWLPERSWGIDFVGEGACKIKATYSYDVKKPVVRDSVFGSRMVVMREVPGKIWNGSVTSGEVEITITGKVQPNKEP